jgi:putative transposase
VQHAVEADFAVLLAAHAELELPDGRQRVVRHGHDSVRPIQMGIRSVEVAEPKVRDRSATTADECIRCASSVLPKRPRRTNSLDVLLPAPFLRGVSTGDFQDVVTALLGKDAPNVSSAVIARLKSGRENEYRRGQGRDLSARRYICFWADGVYLQARMEPQAKCMLMLIGATPEGKKVFAAIPSTASLRTQSRVSRHSNFPSSISRWVISSSAIGTMPRTRLALSSG